MKQNKGVPGFELATYTTCPSEASVYTAVYICRVLFFFCGWDVAHCCEHCWNKSVMRRIMCSQQTSLRARASLQYTV